MLFDTNHAYTSEQLVTLTNVRKDIIQHLSLHHDHKFILWFLGNCGVVAIDDKHKKIDLWIPNEFVFGQVKKIFFKSLKEAVQATYNQQFTCELMIFEPFQSWKRNNLQLDIKKLLKISTTDSKISQPDLLEKVGNSESLSTISSLGYQLQHHLSFDAIIPGANIQFALSAARTVAETPWTAYSPLFIYGHVGLGKTHLLNAIGNAVVKYHPGKNVLFIPTTQLIDHIINGIRKNKLQSLLNQFKKVDVLLLDDVQFLSNKDRTQEIFHNIFNEMQQAGKQIVLTSDRAPRELNNIEARLKSRFWNGLICDITEPDFETRLAILQSKVALKGEHIDSEFLTILAETITSNVRELEGAVNIILTKRILSKQPTTLDTIHECLRTLGYKIKNEQTISLEEMSTLNTRSIMSFDTIVDYAAAYYSISIADLKSDKRSQDISLTRQMLMVIAKQKFWRTLEKIGNYFGGKNHAAVIYAIKQFPRKLKADPALNHDYTLVLEQVEK